MTVREFIAQLQEALDEAVVGSVSGKQIIATFRAPSSGFCGPTIRPKYLGESETGGRYGLTRTHVERILEAFDVTLPPEFA